MRGRALSVSRSLPRRRHAGVRVTFHLPLGGTGPVLASIPLPPCHFIRLAQSSASVRTWLPHRPAVVGVRGLVVCHCHLPPHGAAAAFRWSARGCATSVAMGTPSRGLSRRTGYGGRAPHSPLSVRHGRAVRESRGATLPVLDAGAESTGLCRASPAHRPSAIVRVSCCGRDARPAR